MRMMLASFYALSIELNKWHQHKTEIIGGERVTIMQNKADDMAKRMTITVDDDVYEILEKWADEEVRTVANLAAALVTIAARDKQTKKSSAKGNRE